MSLEFKTARVVEDQEPDSEESVGVEEPVETPKKKSHKKVVVEEFVVSEAGYKEEDKDEPMAVVGTVASKGSPIGDLIEDRRFQLRAKAIAMREHLASQALVKTLIPRAEGEPKDATQSYSINGFCFYVRKGVFQNVPEDVANMISKTYGQDARVLADHPLNLNNNTAAAREFSRR